MKTLCSIIFAFTFGSAVAQGDIYYQHAEPISEKPYWTAKLNSSKNNTVLSFFDKNNQLLYKEDLPGKVVVPSKRNIKKFDKMLALMLANKLVSEHLTTLAVTSTTKSYALNNSSLQASDLLRYPNGIETRIYTRESGKLIIYIANPNLRKLNLILKDQEEHLIYFENTCLEKYGRDLDITNLEPGQYMFSVSSGKASESFTLDVGRADQYHLRQIASF